MRRIIFPIVDDFEVFDLAGPAQVFHEARTLGGDYELLFCALERSVRSHQGLVLGKASRLPAARASDVVIVPGSGALRDAGKRKAHRDLESWLRGAYDAGATIASVCVGAFLLGRAGLLDRHACTTHWRRVDELQRTFPRARVSADRLFVFDGRVATSAGIAAGVDMALAMVENHHGAKVAAAIAREMVVSARRAGSDSQLNPMLRYRNHLESGIHAVQDRIIDEPAERHSLDDLARVASVSRRHLTRVFRAATGVSITEYHNAIRLEHARTLLADPRLTVEAVAERCGLSDARHLRRLWKEAFGSNPRPLAGR